MYINLRDSKKKKRVPKKLSQGYFLRHIAEAALIRIKAYRLVWLHPSRILEIFWSLGMKSLERTWKIGIFPAKREKFNRGGEWYADGRRQVPQTFSLMRSVTSSERRALLRLPVTWAESTCWAGGRGMRQKELRAGRQWSPWEWVKGKPKSTLMLCVYTRERQKNEVHTVEVGLGKTVTYKTINLGNVLYLNNS